MSVQIQKKKKNKGNHVVISDWHSLCHFVYQEIQYYQEILCLIVDVINIIIGGNKTNHLSA